MKNNNNQTTNNQILKGFNSGFLSTIFLSLLKGNCCSFFDLEKEGNRGISIENSPIYGSDEMSVNENLLLIMIENQVFWI